MCGAYRASLTGPRQHRPTALSHAALTPAMTGYLPVVSAASLLAADTPSEQLPSDALLQTWHRLRLAVLHSVWAASQIAQASRPTQAPDASQDAFRCLHPQAKEFTHTATNNASSARIDRWLVSDGLLPSVSAASVTDLILSDHYGVAVTVSPADAPPRGPRLWSMPSAIISHPAFKTLMTAQIQSFLRLMQ
ncbi:MAG: hypothetical protein FRX49_06105 [Trebouxia sp. A1-2]|nr:MAG: hypothetical protein FRX49_06105 [Trebouxia sp. A1-2]